MDGPSGFLGFLQTGAWTLNAAVVTSTRQSPDGCLVPTEPLAHVVSGFLQNWRRERPPTAGQFHADDYEVVEPIRGLAYLSDNSGVPEATIHRILARRSTMTELRVADALVSALDRTDLFHDGEPPSLPISPNPSASFEARMSCCGGSSDYGSLNGSAAW